MVYLESTLPSLPVSAEMIERAAAAALSNQKVEGDLTVGLCDDAQLQQLNLQYLGVDSPTDVLAFASSDKDPDSGRLYLGDVIISIPQAQTHAQAAGHPLASEVQLLVVHGVLHLLGYDHAQAATKSRMWAVQAEVLQEIGLAKIQIGES
jgi:probable rRNA maturation factor